MTEQQWLATDDPRAMLAALREVGRANDRKLRLFAVAVCRRHWALLDDGARSAVEVGERYADGNGTPDDLRDVWVIDELASSAVELFAPQAAEDAIYEATFVANKTGRPGTDEAKAQADLLRCIFGNPFRSAPRFDPTWLTPTLLVLARVMYESRSFDRMAALSEALQVTGCADTGILKHCRSETEHVRGCWVVDLVLAKA